MQTLTIPYTCEPAGSERIEAIRRVTSVAVRMAYAHAAWWDEETKDWRFRSDRDVRDHVKGKLTHHKVADAWLLHCAALEGMELRKARPDGRMVFGGRQNLERRRKGLIVNEGWKALRLRPLTSRGDKQYAGNRHFHLSSDARTCTFACYGQEVRLAPPELHGKWGSLVKAVALCASAKDMNVTFRIDGRNLQVTFDPLDLRKLAPGLSLNQVKDREAAAKGHKRRGRPRREAYVAPIPPWSEDMRRPVHPEWLEAIRPWRAGRSASTSTRAGSA